MYTKSRSSWSYCSVHNLIKNDGGRFQGVCRVIFHLTEIIVCLQTKPTRMKTFSRTENIGTFTQGCTLEIVWVECLKPHKHPGSLLSSPYPYPPLVSVWVRYYTTLDDPTKQRVMKTCKIYSQIKRKRLFNWRSFNGTVIPLMHNILWKIKYLSRSLGSWWMAQQVKLLLPKLLTWVQPPGLTC